MKDTRQWQLSPVQFHDEHPVFLSLGHPLLSVHSRAYIPSPMLTLLAPNMSFQ